MNLKDKNEVVVKPNPFTLQQTKFAMLGPPV